MGEAWRDSGIGGEVGRGKEGGIGARLEERIDIRKASDNLPL